MDARILKVAVLVAAMGSLGASKRTANFIVTAPTAEQAQAIASAAERFRRDLAIEWLGREMPAWGEPCPITAQVGPRMGAGGATSFLFERGEVFGWRMTIQGSLERILDSVLPHEVTHTIFASHFRRPLPRWADEGACTTVEHESERTKQQVMLVDFLRTSRGIAFSRMFAMKEYPHDVMPLYSQGYSLARFLIAQGGQRKFLMYLADGMRDEDWQRATKIHYGFVNLAMLQDTWLDWVRRGSPSIDATKPTPGRPAPSLLADNRRPRPEPNLIYRAQSADDQPAAANRTYAAEAAAASERTVASDGQAQPPTARGAQGRSWHPPTDGERDANASASAMGSREVSAAAMRDVASPTADPTKAVDPAAVAGGASHQLTRPQPAEKSRQIILEWNKPQRGDDSAAANPAVQESHSASDQPYGR